MYLYIKNNNVVTSRGKFCVKGITRKNIIDICKENDIKVIQKNFKLKDVMDADEAFVTGTFANIIPVRQINSKKFKINQSNMSLYIRKLFISKINKIASK